MDAEVSEFLAHAQTLERVAWRGFTFHRVQMLGMEGREAVLVKAGVGKVFTALVAQKLIDTFAPSALLFTGVAGALNPAYDIGDVVVARDCVQHDVDGRALGFPRGNLLYTDWTSFPADPSLVEAALAARPPADGPGSPGHRIFAGRILTGDQFMNRDEINHHRHLVEELKGDAVEMEGGALAQVAAVNGLPYAVIRTLSDRADGDAVADFQRFLPVVAKNSFAVVKAILAGYSPG